MIPEIRINNMYSHLYQSEFERTGKNRDKSYETMMEIGETNPVQKTKTLFTESLFNRYRNNLILDHGMIPPNCCYIESVKDGNIIIIEEPPTIRTISMELPLHNEIHQLKNEGKLEKYGYNDLTLTPKINKFKLTLALPYVIFILYLNKDNKLYISQIFFRTSQMFGFSDCLFKAPLPNISHDEDICLGVTIEGRSTLEVVQKTIMAFWSSSFNTDYLNNYETYETVPIIRNYLEWEYMTKTNPMFIYNTDWILSNNKNIYDNLINLKNRYQINLSDKQNLFNNLIESFTKSTSVNKINYPNKIKNESELYYDISQAIPLECDNIMLFLNIGDNIIFNNGNIGYIESFIGDDTGIKFILIDLNGRQIFMRYTKKLHTYIIDNIHKQRMSQTAVINNGTVITPGDIIINNDYYNQIKYIRKSRGENENDYEVKIGNEYLFAHEINGNVISTDTITIDDMTFERNVNYILIKNNYITTAVRKYITCQYVNVNLNRQHNSFDNIPLEFKTYNETLMINQIDIQNSMFIKEEDLIEMPETFRIGGIIYSNNNKIDPNNKIYKNKNMIIFNDSMYHFADYNKIKECINGDTFFIPGADFDTTFNIGDKVITSNWSTPMDVLTIKTIIKFEYDEDENNIYFILKDNNNNITKQLYVNGNIYNILTGTIRKITNQYNELYVGMKIKAKETKIIRFPKKDVNIIVAIIIDTGRSPLILCSNGYTLWYSTVVEKFDLIDIKSKRWNKLKHTELNMNNFSYQPGDIVKYHFDSTSRYLISFNNRTKNTIIENLESYIGIDNNKSVLYNADLILNCIPTPRIAKNKLDDNIITGHYHFHGGLIEENKSINMGFINY